MRICSLSSGSKGNATFVASEKSKILVDAGHSGRTIELLLKSIGEDARDLDAIFVTHEHGDHIKGVGVLSRRYDLPIVANEKTWLAMQAKIGPIDSKNIFVFKTNTFFHYRDMDVHAISTFHDAADPVAFVFYQNQHKISILTDTGIVTEAIKSAVHGSDAIILESNHDVDMLQTGPYPYRLKERILSDHGHLSNGMAQDMLADILLGKNENIILGHLSDENNLEDLAYNGVFSRLTNLGLKVNKDIHLQVAPKLSKGQMIDLNKK